MPLPLSLRRHALLVLTVLFMLGASVSHAALLQLAPEPASATPGATVSIDIAVSDLGNFGPESLGAFDLAVEFDTAALSFIGYSLGSFLGDVAQFEAIDASAGDVGGAVNVAAVSLLSAAALDASQPGEFILATLNFLVADPATTATTQLAVASGAVLGDALGAQIAVTAQASANIEIAAASVPAPGTLLLLITSLCGLLVAAKRRRHIYPYQRQN